jgi:hypothetical protein
MKNNRTKNNKNRDFILFKYNNFKILRKNNMKVPFLFFASLYFIVACNNHTDKKEEENVVTINKTKSIQSDQELIGSYVGTFGENSYDDNKVRLLITKIESNLVEGSTIVGGNDRPFKGTIKVADDKYVIHASEPGDDKYDGVFNFEIDANNPNLLKCDWSPFKNTVSPKKYTLERRNFVYNPTAGRYNITSTTLLTTEDVENRGKYTLGYMRNEIFARHGYCFKKKNSVKCLNWKIGMFPTL